MNKEPRIILLDIETLPNLTEVLKVYPRLSNYYGLTLKADITSIICVGWKVLGENKTHCITAWDFKTRWKKNINDDYMVCKQIYNVLKTADAVITQNGKKFDIPHIQTRLLLNKLPRLPEILHIDTKVIAKKNLSFFSNSLDAMGSNLVNERKLDNGGWDLWVKVYNKNINAMKLIKDYCIQDVNLLEKIFNKLKPFVANLPNYALYTTGTYKCCVNCGSVRIHKDGYRYMKNRVMRRWRCNDCGSHSCEKIENIKPILK